MKTKDVYSGLNITHSFYSRVVKRFFDISISLTAILLLSAVLFILYLLTLIFLGRPAIYKQTRPGKNHKIFYIYKFRSMNNKKDKDGNLLPDEQRITKFGKFLRKTSLDELPQLFCILKGDMSIVGPRPRLVKDMMFYDKEIFDMYLITPGLTGPTQSDGRNRNTWEQVFEKDIEYMQNITFINDLKIFFKTFTSVFTDKGDSRSNSEEDVEGSKEQEYYYADYIKRIGKITEDQYKYGVELSRLTIAKRARIAYHIELHDKEYFYKLKTEREERKKAWLEAKARVDAEAEERAEENLNSKNNNSTENAS